MILKIGEKIKELREKKNITQNKMAEYLGITEQAISRWENGGGYPDMEMIPAISNFLDISIDELFEADKKAERLAKIKQDIFSKFADGFIEETIELCRNALKEFPNDYELTYNLFQSLPWEFDKNKDEIFELGERIMNDCDDYNIKIQTVSIMAEYYMMLGNDKGEKLAETLPHLNFGINTSKERILSRILPDINERVKRKKFMLLTLAGEVVNGIDELADSLPADEKIAVREKAVQVMNILFENGDYSAQNMALHRIYRKMTEDYLRSGEQEKALDCLEKSSEYCIAVENNTVFNHTSLLIRDLENNIFVYNHGSPSNISYSFIHDFLLKRDIYSPIRETDRFKAVIANLEQYAKSEKAEK